MKRQNPTGQNPVPREKKLFDPGTLLLVIYTLLAALIVASSALNVETGIPHGEKWTQKSALLSEAETLPSFGSKENAW